MKRLIPVLCVTVLAAVCLLLLPGGQQEAQAGGDPTGACCLPGGDCKTISEADCDAANDVWKGEGTDCFFILCADCPADLNDDGLVNTADFLVMLSWWGACP